MPLCVCIYIYLFILHSHRVSQKDKYQYPIHQHYILRPLQQRILCMSSDLPYIVHHSEISTTINKLNLHAPHPPH